ncbi:hypothetical protein MKQ68_17470 [Chitinophaga horti]|uniref:Tetratricopeptide repeat protein n=1 Tax=Chitinophaga horti TaxID=2920382 RepID=A0ABY6IWX5_9BACT|nr:hypothetical protein [Chitinophaga horti]UYQ91879.1 hypothetical protein MKQ68_17470 [Chitinophaga horti]
MNAFDHELIDRYLRGELTGEVLREFKQRLATDANLRRAMDTQQQVEASLRYELHPDQQQRAFQQTLEENRSHITTPMRKHSRSVPKFVIAAAAIAAMVAGTLFLAPWEKDLYRQYSGITMTSPAERGQNDQADLVQAADLFNDKSYPAAITILGKALVSDSANAYARFYRGVALLESGQLPEARTDLQKIYEGNSLFKYDAAFYLALTYLKDDQPELCRQWLQKIPEDAANYEKAQHLLKDL